jgi:hypothetical protein
MNIILNSGREIFLKSIYQYYTYGGLLAGYPNKRINDRHIQNSLKYALEKMYAPTVYLVPPPSIEVDIDERSREHYKDVIRIPYITCYGQFESSQLDNSNDGSWLTIVWYQDKFAMPIDSSVIEHIKTIDWESEAEGFEF